MVAVRISHFATSDEVTDTSIRVITAEKRQYGDYVCKAFNVLGNAEVTIRLHGKRADVLNVFNEFVVYRTAIGSFFRFVSGNGILDTRVDKSRSYTRHES